MLIAIIVFVVAYILIISEKIPNSITAILGAFAVILFGILTQDQAIHFIDFGTIGLLTGMMLIVSVLKRTGIFEYIAIKALKSTAGNPSKILISLSIITALLSALLDNVTTVLILVPITFAIADTIKLNPMPFLISEILFSNIGGTATLIGDPPNIMIAGATGFTFLDFIANNVPIILVISFILLYLIKWIYRNDLKPVEGAEIHISYFDETKVIHNYKFLTKNLIVFVFVIIGFMTHALHGLELATIALWGGFTMMLISNIEPEEILKDVEWSTLFFFAGLFILIGALEQTHVIYFVSEKLVHLTKGSLTALTMVILWGSAIASSFVDNIPYTATMISVIKTIIHGSTINPTPLWWSLSLGACLGGNGTIVGASANLIVAGFARKNGVVISFKDFFLIGFPLMLLSVLIANVYVVLRYLIF